MSHLTDVIEIASNFVRLLPPLNTLEERSVEYWNLLEVNSPNILSMIGNQEYVQDKISLLDNSTKQIICIWAGLPPLQNRSDEEHIIDYIIRHQDNRGFQIILHLIDFLNGRRPDAIETISKIILPIDRFNFVFESEIEKNSKRFCYAILAFLENPHLLQTLLLFENAERIGYQRYYLTSKFPDVEDQTQIDEITQRIEQKIEQGINRASLTFGLINDALEEYERTHGQKQSLCFDVFHDDSLDITLIFILRTFRETSIREVDGTVFADEAELIVLRVYNGMKTVDIHSESGIGQPITTALASYIMDEEYVQFIPSDETTNEAEARTLINALMEGSDSRLQFRELYLDTAPIVGSPNIIIRSDEDQSINRAISFISQRNIDLLHDLHNVKNIKIGYEIILPEGERKNYIFKIIFQPLGLNLYYLLYSTANVASRFRSQFEHHLRENYNVRVFPGKG